MALSEIEGVGKELDRFFVGHGSIVGTRAVMSRCRYLSVSADMP